ncbi:MFS transporter [Allosediminivita pacifica]|uniref:Major Facilitator Superfamily protein n=1 Tax=Allosediminivita pacifica TaxID=1267769 RepID=A0A2T6B7Q8_9RHOB|nr:MFS transporter [Allosediminivita pacifica]PTX52121.1 hypothetical protein C8N44_102166 [Allosediminivita pacifica]GGA96970.1 MFS transporter [Allosediminivita pacifica]
MSDATPATQVPTEPPVSVRAALPYMLASALLALSQGLGQGFVSANIPQIAGDIGATTTEASWLMAAYLIPRASLPLMLIKIRTQFGLRRFAEVGIVAYVIVAFAALWIDDLRSAIVVQFLSGVAGAPLSTLAFLYMLEKLPRALKLTLGLPLALAVIFSGANLARVISPALLGDNGMLWMHLTTLGMAMVSLMLVYLLPLTPVPRQKVIRPLDITSFALIATGFGGLTISFIMGPIHWWTDAPWIGWLLAGSVAAITLAAVTELHREAPLLDIRWITSPEILHLAGALLLMRLLMAEQAAGAPRLMQALGVGNAQMVTLFALIVLATVLGALACVALMRPGREPQFHLVALLLIAAGAFMDSHATALTRPEQMYVSQTLIAFAAMLFLPPAMMAGLMKAMAKGPSYLLSFIVVFLSTQLLGSVLASGLFTTLVNQRQAHHLQVLREQLMTSDPATLSVLAQGTRLAQSQVADALAARGQALSQIVGTLTREATVLAYDDAYFLIFLVALGGASALLLHLLRDVLSARIEARRAPSHPEPTT